tara:strand:- start:477 stop:1001 length:525 start_codon:yes stop_codon:yes gene_type:complete
MTSYKIQELIDEHKEDMNENLYLQLCNKLMKLNKEEEKEEEEEQKVFKITYLEPYIKNTKSKTFEIDMKRKQLYIPLTKKEHKQIVDRLDKLGHFTAHLFYHKMDENVKIDWSHTKTEFDEDLYEECCGDPDTRECLRMDCDIGDCALMTKSTDFQVKCWREIVKIEKYDNPQC